MRYVRESKENPSSNSPFRIKYVYWAFENAEEFLEFANERFKKHKHPALTLPNDEWRQIKKLIG